MLIPIPASIEDQKQVGGRAWLSHLPRTAPHPAPPLLTLLPLAVEARRVRAGQCDIPAAAWMRDLLAAAFGR